MARGLNESTKDCQESLKLFWESLEKSGANPHGILEHPEMPLGVLINSKLNHSESLGNPPGTFNQSTWTPRNPYRTAREYLSNLLQTYREG